MTVRTILHNWPSTEAGGPIQKLGSQEGCFPSTAQIPIHNRYPGSCDFMSTRPWSIHWGHDYCCYHKTNDFHKQTCPQKQQEQQKHGFHFIFVLLLYYPHSSEQLVPKALRESDEGGLWLPRPYPVLKLAARVWKHSYNSQLATCVLIMLIMIFYIQTFFFSNLLFPYSFSLIPSLECLSPESYKQKYFLYSVLIFSWFYHAYSTIWN